jgi:hypothetical protein
MISEGIDHPPETRRHGVWAPAFAGATQFERATDVSKKASKDGFWGADGGPTAKKSLLTH